MFLGLRTVSYAAPDLESLKAWYTHVLGYGPYFDQPFYVGFNVGGFELGLVPDAKAGAAGATAYWGVSNLDQSLARLLEVGAKLHEAVTDVGGGIRVASVIDPAGNVLGIIENPHFQLPQN